MTTAARKIPTIPAGPEVRSIRAVELRAEGEGAALKLVGYAAVFNSRSQDFGGWVEVIKPGTFARALREKQDVRCLFNHDSNQVLGRSASGTLKLEEDSKGLRFECTPPDTQNARDVMSLVKRGDVNQCSFSFSIHRGENGDGGVNWLFPPEGPAVRELLDVDLHDVGPVTEPAYEATEVSVRELPAARSRAGLDSTPSAQLARLRLAEASA